MTVLPVRYFLLVWQNSPAMIHWAMVRIRRPGRIWKTANQDFWESQFTVVDEEVKCLQRRFGETHLGVPLLDRRDRRI